MSVSWKIGLVCNGCGTRSGDTPTSHAGYGPELKVLRDQLARDGWVSLRGPGRGRPVRDLCKSCNLARRHY